MILFDGTDIKTIQKSLSSFMHITESKFVKCVDEYLCMNLSNLSEVNLSNFYEYWKIHESFTDPHQENFDQSILFHKTSIIDNGNHIKSNGLLPLRQVILGKSPLSDYLNKYGLKFFYKNNKYWYSLNGLSYELTKIENAIQPNEKAQNYLFNRLNNLEGVGIGGYSLLSLATDKNDYPHIKNQPEIFYHINRLCSGISSEWISSSRSVIIRCLINVDWIDISNASFQIADDGFQLFSEWRTKKLFNWNVPLISNYWYTFLHESQLIPADNILEFIDY